MVVRAPGRTPRPAHTSAIVDAVDPAEWDDLADRAQGAPFQRPGWVLAWQRAFDEGDIDYAVVRDRGTLTALRRR